MFSKTAIVAILISLCQMLILLAAGLIDIVKFLLERRVAKRNQVKLEKKVKMLDVVVKLLRNKQ